VNELCFHGCAAYVLCVFTLPKPSINSQTRTSYFCAVTIHGCAAYVLCVFCVRVVCIPPRPGTGRLRFPVSLTAADRTLTELTERRFAALIGATCGTHNALLTPAAQWKHQAGRHRLSPATVASTSHFLHTRDSQDSPTFLRHQGGVACHVHARPLFALPPAYPRATRHSREIGGSTFFRPRIPFQGRISPRSTIFLCHFDGTLMVLC
jgi:hypothetical protein